MLRVILLIVFLAPALATAKAEEQKEKYPRVVVGKISDKDGKPIAAARIEYGHYRTHSDQREFTLTDEKGLYRLAVMKAGPDFRLGVSATGYAPTYRDNFLPGPATDPSEFSTKLDDGDSVVLKFVTRGGVPVPGVYIRPTTPQSGFYSSFSSPTPATPLPGFDRVLITDDDGCVSLDSLPVLPSDVRTEGKKTRHAMPWLGLEISNEKNGSYSQYTVAPETVHDTKAGEPVIISISASFLRKDQPRDGLLKAEVVDKETGQPIKDFIVVRRYDPKAISISSEDGRFTSGGKLQRGRKYQTRVFATGYAVGVVDLVANAKEAAGEQVFDLVKHPSFRGRLVNEEDQPLANVEVVSGVAREKSGYIDWGGLDDYADGHHCLTNVLRVKTNENGEFVIPESPDQLASIIIRTSGYMRKAVRPENRPKANANGISTIQLSKGADLTVVIDRNSPLGKTATAIGVTPKFRQPEDGFDHMNSSVRSKGVDEETYRGLIPGRYSVSIYTETEDFVFKCCTKTIEVKSGESVRTEIGKMPGELTLAGTTSPFSRVTLRINAKPDQPHTFALRADVDGEFSLTGLPAGEVFFESTPPNSTVYGYRRSFSGNSLKQTLKINLTEDKLDVQAPPPKSQLQELEVELEEIP